MFTAQLGTDSTVVVSGNAASAAVGASSSSHGKVPGDVGGQEEDAALCSIRTLFDDAVRQRYNGFHIFTGKAAITLYADTLEEKTYWMTLIEQVCGAGCRCVARCLKVKWRPPPGLRVHTPLFREGYYPQKTANFRDQHNTSTSTRARGQTKACLLCGGSSLPPHHHHQCAQEVPSHTSGGQHPPNFTVLGQALCEVLPVPAREGRQGAEEPVGKGNIVPLPPTGNTFPGALRQAMYTIYF